MVKLATNRETNADMFLKVRSGEKVEHCSPKAGVAGSIPAGRTNSHKAFSELARSHFLELQLTAVLVAPSSLHPLR